MTEGESIFCSERTVDNLLKLSSDCSVIFERRICELSELVDASIDYVDLNFGNEIGIYEKLSLLSESFPQYDSFDDSVILECDRSQVGFLVSRLCLADKSVFSELYVTESNRRGKGICEKSFLIDRSADESFVYVKNAYSDEAYDVFSQEFSDPKVRYASSLKEAVGLVESGAVAYCILPLEEKGARLASIAELLYRSDLKINSVIPVFGFDGNADVKYALVSRYFTVPEPSPGDDRYLEIRIEQNSSRSLSDILCSAESLGIQIYRVNTLSFDTEDGMRDYYSVVFCGEEVDFTALLVFLTLFVPEYSAIGIYKNLET